MSEKISGSMQYLYFGDPTHVHYAAEGVEFKANINHDKRTKRENWTVSFGYFPNAPESPCDSMRITCKLGFLREIIELADSIEDVRSNR